MAPKALSPSHVVIGPVRLSFPALFEPKPVMRGDDKLKYQASLLLPPDYDQKPIVAAMRVVIAEKWGPKIPKMKYGSPIKSCDEKEKPLAGYESGWFFINTKSDFQPTVVDQQLNVVLEPKLVYAGCWVRAHINAYTYDNRFGKGVSFGLNAIQFVKNGERIDGRADVTDIFEPIEFEGDEPLAGGAADSDSSEASAADLFG